MRRDLLSSAAELGDEDGTDPQVFHEKPWNRPTQAGRKAAQLCGQAADALRGILAGLADGVLQNLMVVAVEPAPNTGRLLVTVAASKPADATDFTTNEVLEHLTKATGRIRTEVAAAINRRKAPELAWRVTWC